ncbi:uncharacterized protein LOC141631874 [Silene latifolia]|uniref:uncharacterized protein LOC141631874 n=1 Tax=Silene latifolia TaxID=37657 RepID=UPI003D77A5A5
MPGLSPKIVVHRLAIKKGTSPKKQPQRRFRPELVPEIEKEVNKLIEAGFIREVKYSTWIANIVPFRKKNGQLCICVDFRDLNDACPKDDFPLPVTDLMIDATTDHEALSFMDCTADRKERALYYLSRTSVGAELNYAPIEKICLALVFAIQKLRHYMQAHTIHVVSKFDPIKYILSRPVLSGRLAKWEVLLKQYDLVFVPQKAVKGQAIADFFADHPVPAEWEISDDLPGEEIFYVDVLPPWKIYFDGAARQDGAGAGVVFKLVVKQVLGEYEVKKEDLIPYHQRALQLLNQIDDIHVGHVPRSANKLADALSNLAATLALGAEESMQVPVCNRWAVSLLEGEENVDTTNMICVYTADEDDWRQPIIDLLDHQKLPDDPRHKVEIRRRDSKFIHYKGMLYRRSFSGQWLRCLSKDEAAEAMHEAHSGICGAHQSGPKLHDRVKRMGYYWPTMVQDCMDFAKKCEPCQFYANFIHQPPEPLHPTVSSWPFEAWGLDVVGHLTPKASNGHEYGVPQRITTDNGKQFFNHLMTSLGEKFKFKQYKSSMYNASANGLAEAFNKTICNLLRKIPSLRIAIHEGLTDDENGKLQLAELESLDKKRLEAQQKLQ